MPSFHINLFETLLTAPSDLLKVQDSHTILVNCVEALVVTYSSGGDGHLEQPTTAMSWSEPCVQQWLMTAACHCINLPACLYGADWQKSWMMASSLENLTALAGVCTHGPYAHQPVAGVRDASGVFVSRATAEYPTTFLFRQCHSWIFRWKLGSMVSTWMIITYL